MSTPAPEHRLLAHTDYFAVAQARLSAWALPAAEVCRDTVDALGAARGGRPRLSTVPAR